jgi:hypothetical protein
MAVVQPQQFTTSDANRLVWVLNRDPERDYVETYKDDEIRIPKNLGRVPALVTNGGNLMPWLSARKFLGQPVAQSQKTPHGEIINMGKPLQTVELTDEERMEIAGTTPEHLRKVSKEDELAAQNTCTLCAEPISFASKKGLESHLKKEHPSRTPIEE